jgi:hypothetical protein
VWLFFDPIAGWPSALDRTTMPAATSCAKLAYSAEGITSISGEITVNRDLTTLARVRLNVGRCLLRAQR